LHKKKDIGREVVWPKIDLNEKEMEGLMMMPPNKLGHRPVYIQG
jgi:hypothetical protein